MPGATMTRPTCGTITVLHRCDGASRRVWYAVYRVRLMYRVTGEPGAWCADINARSSSRLAIVENVTAQTYGAIARPYATPDAPAVQP